MQRSPPFALALLSLACGLFPELESYGECRDQRCGDASMTAGGSGGTSSGGAGGGAGSDPCGSYKATKMVPAGELGFCIDATEVSAGDYEAFYVEVGAIPQGEPAECAWNVSRKPPAYVLAGVSPTGPAQGVNWCNARAFCLWAGKRLCGKTGGGSLALAEANGTTSEWYLACSKNGAFAYPYGDQYVADRCNDNRPDAGAFAATPVGSLTTCEGGYPGLFDMSGNIQEWVDACDSGTDASTPCGINGGIWTFAGGSQSAVHCSFSDSLPRESDDWPVGFRCCKDI